MLIEIATNDATIDWSAKGVNRVAQNVYNLITTIRYEVAYDRTLGLTAAFVDKPLPIAISEATAEIYEIVSEREPRATVQDVEFIGTDNEGNMQFKVVIDVESN